MSETSDSERVEKFVAELHAKCRTDLAREKERAKEILAQLPEGMQHCTIRFKSCKKGHGWLTADNWVQHGCPTCERDALADRLRVAREAMEEIVALATQERPAWQWDARAIASEALKRTKP